MSPLKKTFPGNVHIITGWWFGTFLFFHLLGIIIPTEYIWNNV
jgi:hypothetical protein